MSALAFVLAAGLTAAPSSAEGLHVHLRDTLSIARPGTTAAYAVDPEVVEITLADGQVTLRGRARGETLVVVVGAGGVDTWEVAVDAPPTLVAAAPAAARQSAVWGEVYDSETSRVTSTLDVNASARGTPVQFQAVNVTKSRDIDDGFARSTIPFAALSIGSGHRRLTLGDETVSRSPLTLDGTLLRGLHLREGRLEVHTGFASALMYGTLFVPAARETAAGASYSFGGSSLRVSPSLYFFPDAATARPGARTVLPGVLVEKDGAKGLQLLGEVGWSGRLAGAGEIAYDGAVHRLRGRFRHQPYALPALSLGHPQGTFADVSWSARVRRSLGITVTGASALYDDPRAPQRTSGATGEVAWNLGHNWSARAGLGAGRYDAERAPRVDTLSVPLGLAFDSGRFGVAALGRYQANSASNRGGPGGRLSVHAGGRLRLSAYADYQRDAPTLSLVLHDRPEVARALAEQGLVARTPEEIARLLDESALLLAPGAGTARLTLDPTRIQAGFDATWSSRRTQVRLHGLFDRAETVSRWRETRLGTLSLTQRIGATELTAAYTRWESDAVELGRRGGTFQVGIRQRFSAGEPGSLRRLRVAGQVYRDEDATGVAGVTVRLGDGRTTVTDRGGYFAFDGVGRRGRRVQAVLPSDNAFFTTPSTVEARDAAPVRFGLRFPEGRLDGFVRDDAGHPRTGLTLRLEGARGSASAVSDSSGAFVLHAPDGVYRLAVDPESLPAGYEAADEPSRDVRLALGAPTHVEVSVRAQRSIGGRIVGGGANVEIRLREAGRTVRTDERGRFLFRHVPPGADTLEASLGSRVVTRAVQVPDGPVSLRDLELE
jgi:hypothetical protein